MEEQLFLGYVESDPELSGLGAVAKAKIVKAVAGVARKVADRKGVVPPALIRFSTRTDLLTKPERDSLNEKSSQSTVMHMYRNVQFTGAANGIVEMIDRNLDPARGVTNFKGELLPTGTKMLIDEIGIGYGTHATSVLPAEIEYTTFGLNYVGLQNAELNVSLGGVTLLADVPMKNFFCWETGAAPINIDHRGIVFKVPVDSILWDDKTALQVTIKFPGAVTAPAGVNTFLSLNLYGAGFQPNRK